MHNAASISAVMPLVKAKNLRPLKVPFYKLKTIPFTSLFGKNEIQFGTNENQFGTNEIQFGTNENQRGRNENQFGRN